MPSSLRAGAPGRLWNAGPFSLSQPAGEGVGATRLLGEPGQPRLGNLEPHPGPVDLVAQVRQLARPALDRVIAHRHVAFPAPRRALGELEVEPGVGDRLAQAARL